MFFDNWYGLIRVFVVAILAYAALIFWLRVSGKRTLSKWNAFDFVVTVAVGSMFASVIISKDIAFLEGVSGFALIILLQFVVTWVAVRSRAFEKLIKARPTLLLDRGRFLHEALRSQRTTESEVRTAVRAAGIASLDDVEAVVLETDGNLSVVKKSNDGSRSALEDVEGVRQD